MYRKALAGVVLALALGSLVFIGYIYTQNNQAMLANQAAQVEAIPTPTPTMTPLNIIGIIRSTGLSSEEKTKFDLKFSDYQITDVEAATSKTVTGYYLESASVDIKDNLGKCVKISGLIPWDWADVAKTTTAYNRSVLVPQLIQRLGVSACSPYSSNISNPTPGKLEKLIGVLEYAKRPAPDINYDYKLLLTTPYVDQTLGEIKVIDLIPRDNSVWQNMDAAINRSVTVTGEMLWGYAESRYLSVTSISVSK